MCCCFKGNKVDLREMGCVLNVLYSLTIKFCVEIVVSAVELCAYRNS